jgi:steroid delta-isomerase-like uncharacterized protein
MNAREVVELEAQLHRAKAWERLGNVYTDDIEFVAADGTKIVGRDRVVDLLRREDRAFPDGAFTQNVVAVDGPIVVINWIWTGTHDKDFLTPSGQTVPATGRTITVDAISIIEIDNDRIARTRRYHDRVGVLTQLGLLPT